MKVETAARLLDELDALWEMTYMEISRVVAEQDKGWSDEADRLFEFLDWVEKQEAELEGFVGGGVSAV